MTCGEITVAQVISLKFSSRIQLSLRVTQIYRLKLLWFIGINTEHAMSMVMDLLARSVTFTQLMCPIFLKRRQEFHSIALR